MPDVSYRSWRRARQLIAGQSFAISVLVAVASTCAFAFFFGADAELVGALLAFGVVTAVVETFMRNRMKD